MVYCGRPSTGCTTCRKRRIKCDEARPICGQCIKSKRQCLGYREETDILFRNENAATARRVRREPGRPRNSSSSPKSSIFTLPERPNTPSKSALDSENGISSQHFLSFPQPVSWSISVSNEDIAIKFLFDNFDRVPRHSEKSHAYLEFLPALFAKAPSDSALSAVTAAISLGTWGGYTSQPDCLVKARKRYGEAIVRANAAIRDPVAAKKNETLMAILLFALFEALNANAETLPQWNLHTKGAIALVKHRGNEMFEDETSRKLFQAVQQQTMISQLNRPEANQEGHGSSHFWYSDIQNTPADTLTLLICEIPALRNSSMYLLDRARSNENDTAVWDLIGACKAVDSALTAWPESLDEHWRPVTISKVPNVVDPSEIDWERAEAYPGNVIAYSDIWITSIWNTYRNARMFVNAIVLQCLAWLMASSEGSLEETLCSSDHPDCLASRAVLQEMANETCAAVPFQLTMIEESTLDTTPPPSPGATYSKPMERAQKSLYQCTNLTSTPSDIPTHLDGAFNADFTGIPGNLGHEPDRLARSLGAYYLIWPLFVAQAAVTISYYQRRWIKGRLMYISQNFGLKQAELLASLDKCESQSGRPLFTSVKADVQRHQEGHRSRRDWTHEHPWHLL